MLRDRFLGLLLFLTTPLRIVASADALSLEDCLRLAGAHNPRIEAQRAEIAARQAEEGIARSAGRPHLEALGLYPEGALP